MIMVERGIGRDAEGKKKKKRDSLLLTIMKKTCPILEPIGAAPLTHSQPQPW